MNTYLSAVLIIFAVFAAWLGVQHLARVFARRHPEFGPAREEGGGCGSCCGCANRDTCPTSDSKHTHPH
jgi:hypothetical protein